MTHRIFNVDFKKPIRFFIIMMFLAQSAFAQDEAKVELFSPRGVVKDIRQVRVRFSEQMVPFGDPGLLEPFDIQCPEKGRGRWADGKNRIYDFDSDLPGGIKCEFKLKPDLKSISGKPIKGQQKFSFSTGGPAIVDMEPHEYEYLKIKEDQAFVLYLDTKADEVSVLANVRFSVEGIGRRVGIKIIKGEEREKILKAIYWTKQNHYEPDQVMVIQCRQVFPNNSKVSLIWGKNVKSRSGVSNTKDLRFSYTTRKPFNAVFSCGRENASSGCIPVLPMELSFSSPISSKTAENIVMQQSDGTLYHRYTAPKEEDGGSQASGDVDEIVFKGPFPENVSFSIRLPEDIRDDAGRPLENRNKFPLKIKTASLPPLAKFSSRFGIIERDEDAVLPVTLRNLGQGSVQGRMYHPDMKNRQEIIQWLRNVAGAGRKNSVFSKETGIKSFTLPKPLGAKAFEVAGIPLENPGLHIVELESRVLGASLLGEDRPLYVPTAALVTGLSAHLKRGKESSLVWVTSLNTGKAVENARVIVCDCSGQDIWTWKTNEMGIVYIPKDLTDSPGFCKLNVDEESYFDFSQLGALREIDNGYFVFVETSDDMTFLHSSWDQGIETWRYQLPEEPYGSRNRIAHTVLDRSLLRAGETVHMKHIIRKHGISGFSGVEDPEMPVSIVIQHQGSEQWVAFPLKWEKNGTAETMWKIPENSKLGNYLTALFFKPADQLSDMDIGSLSSGYNGEEWIYTGAFRVEEFRIPLMRAVIQPPKEPLINAAGADIDISLRYLSGGGADHAKVKIRKAIQNRVIEFNAYEKFIFAADEVREGITMTDEENGGETSLEKITATDLTLDATGSHRATVPLPKIDKPRDLIAELEFADPNGEIQTASAKIPLWPSRYLIGIKPDSWVSSKNKMKFQVVVLDIAGNPVSGVPVQAGIFRTTYYSHRKRLVGGFYAYENISEIKRIETFTPGKTGTDGMLVCERESGATGNLSIQVTAMDAGGNKTISNCEIWVPGEKYGWFDMSDNDRIDLLPEKKRYEPGETARFQVRVPFSEAEVLTTVEREGILDAYVTHVSGKDPVIEIPVKGNYAPNVFISALCVRGRAKKTGPTAMIDLGKPAFKLGITELKVGWQAHELKVLVSPAKTVYTIREKAKVKIRVRTAAGLPLPAGAEAAVSVVDEGLLELMPNTTWNLLSAMMGPRGYQLGTATAQMQVVGKRHYGLKALPHGGGGGRQVTREMFDTLLFWKSNVMLDENGEAGIEIPLNDAVTGFRIAAVANAGTGLFGSGEASIRTTRDLTLFSGLPPVVREGDVFRAGVTVKNGSDHKMQVEVTGICNDGSQTPLTASVPALLPGESREIGWEVKVPMNVKELTYDIRAKEREGTSTDSLRVTQKVSHAVSTRIFQASIAQADPSMSVAIEKPAGAIPGKGGIRVSLKPGLSGSLSGVISFMKDYPYTCMEQKISRAVALRDEELWKSVAAELPGCMDKDGLVKYFPSCAQGSDVLTAYIYSISHEAGWAIPDHIRQQMEKGLSAFIEGKLNRYEDPVFADLSARKIAALEALSRTGHINPGWFESIFVQPDVWPTSAVIDWLDILLRVQNRVQGHDQKIKEAEQVIRSRMNFQGTRMGFSTETRDYLWQLMVSVDLNAVKAVLTFLNSDSFKEDMPRLMNGAIQRQIRGKWDTTPANAWGVLAVEKFNKKFESVPLTGKTVSMLADMETPMDWETKEEGDVFMLDFPPGKGRLTVTHQGEGKPWVTIQSQAAVPLKIPVSSGYRITKTLIPVDQKEPGRWSKGDVIRVRLDLEAQSDMTWVAVNDPVPAGSTLLGTGLGRDSGLLTRNEEIKGLANPVFIERSFESFKAYYEYVPKGTRTVEYTLRLNNAGRFNLPETRVEALYAPEMFGEIPNAGIIVQ